MLTNRQHKLLMFIDHTIKSRGTAPTLQEMADYLGIKNRSGSHAILSVLIDLGFVRCLPHKRQGIEVIRLPGSAAIAQAAISEAIAEAAGITLNPEDSNDLISVLRARGFDLVERAA